MKKITKRIPFKFTIEHSGVTYNRTVYTNDIIKYLKRLRPTLSGVKWKLVPLKIQVIDGIEYFEDVHGNLREMTFKL